MSTIVGSEAATTVPTGSSETAYTVQDLLQCFWKLSENSFSEKTSFQFPAKTQERAAFELAKILMPTKMKVLPPIITKGLKLDSTPHCRAALEINECLRDVYTSGVEKADASEYGTAEQRYEASLEEGKMLKARFNAQTADFCAQLKENTNVDLYEQQKIAAFLIKAWATTTLEFFQTVQEWLSKYAEETGQTADEMIQSVNTLVPPGGSLTVLLTDETIHKKVELVNSKLGLTLDAPNSISTSTPLEYDDGDECMKILIELGVAAFKWLFFLEFDEIDSTFDPEDEGIQVPSPDDWAQLALCGHIFEMIYKITSPDYPSILREMSIQKAAQVGDTPVCEKANREIVPAANASLPELLGREYNFEIVL